ncbi:MAG: hypothetical protein ABJA35_05525, partial [Parafilimonas sp.]
MKTVFTLIIFFLCLSVYSQNQNKAGRLDSSFGKDGKVLTSFSNSFPDCAAASTMNDGSIITAGTITFSNAVDTGGFLALKYSASGVLDTTFGNKGMSFIKGAGTGQAIAIQSDNKIIIGGYGANFSSSFITIVRLNASGNIDSTFGNNGIISTDDGQNCHDITIQKDGKILIFGEDNMSFLTMRCLTNGTLDQIFGVGGIVKTSFGGHPANGNAIAVDANGKIVVAGDDGESVLLARYNTDGTLDQSFGQEGKIVSNLTTHIDDIYDIALQSDGKIVATGASSTFNRSNVLLVRYLSNGSLDNGFGISGFVVSKLPYSSLSKRLVLQSDNKIVVCGYAINDSIYGHFLIERYMSNGALDSSFNGNGYEITEMDQSDAANAILIQQTGKIVLAGSARETPPNPLVYLIALTRYDNDQSNKQAIITKIRHWLQHHNGIMWNKVNDINNYVVQRSYDGIHFKSIAR